MGNHIFIYLYAIATAFIIAAPKVELKWRRQCAQVMDLQKVGKAKTKSRRPDQTGTQLPSSFFFRSAGNIADLYPIGFMAEHPFSNHLAGETSPYLLQHAANPVQWYPWNEEALEKARQEDKPILVSIGYAACHWCHVMAHESFEDEVVAQFMNENFVNIKIDREERSDIDHIYMDAVQAMTGSGGWPLNVFLTPYLKPFYGGTYFPPRRAFNRPSWKEILESVLQAFRERREKVNEQADRLIQYLQNSSGTFLNAENGLVTPEDDQLIYEVFRNLSEQFDPVDGGFGGAPKFPSTFCLRFLLCYHYYYQSKEALDQALLSLDKMIEGGIYDQLGGGFARYSTDAHWLVPHFEKMLYDNALLLEVLAEAFQITRNKKYEAVIRQTIGFVFRELSEEGKDFYASLDADSEGEEGKFYVWSKEEIEKILGTDADIFCRRYDVGENGNWEGENILHEAVSLGDLAKQFRMDDAELKRKLEDAKLRLFEVRAQRVHPSLDDKKILSWNALMVAALAKCAQALQAEDISDHAMNVLSNLLSSFRIKEGSPEMFHHITKGKPSGHAMLEDYAYLIRSCLQVYEISFDTKWIIQARELTGFVISNFYDEANQFFFMTPSNEPDIVVRTKEFYDGAVPSGNSVMNENLYKLSVLLDERDFASKTEDMLRSIAPGAIRFPASFAWWLIVLSWKMKGSEELVALGERFKESAREINHHYLPNKIIMAAENPDHDFPLLRDKEILNKQTTFYRCKNYACLLPVNNLTEFLKTLVTK